MMVKFQKRLFEQPFIVSATIKIISYKFFSYFIIYITLYPGFELSILNCFAKNAKRSKKKIAPQVKFLLTLAKCFTDLAKLFSINSKLDFINIAMLFSF